MSDAELLHEYVTEHSESAFRSLVERYLPLVYAAALRQVRDAALAQDVAQVVFIILARKAPRFSPTTFLPGWLFRTTRHSAAKAVRTEHRRRRREQEALQMQATHPEDVWQQVAPVLDEALAQLGETDRGAVLLHYFQNKRLRDVGLALGMSEDAAQKRVTRAVEKLRRILLKRGIALPAVALPGLLMSHGALAAPSYLTDDIVCSALSPAALPDPLLDLLQQSSAGPIWPKIVLPITRFAALAIVAGGVVFLATHWPKLRSANSSDYTFDSGITARPRYQPPRVLPEPILAAALPSREMVTPAPKARMPMAPASVGGKAPEFPALTNSPPNTPNFAAGGVHVLPWAAQGGALPSSAGESAPADGGWVYPAGYSYGVSYHAHVGAGYAGQVLDWQAIAYTNRAMWAPIQRSPSVMIKGSAPASGPRKKTN